ncbi:MAG: hypothetical protein ACQUHE_18190, partial [Bacteroidia bacterium]
TAIETADIALMSDDLGKLAWLVKHSRRTLSIIKQNVIFSLLVKSVFVGLTFANKSSLWLAIVADMGATFIVVSNSLRLLHFTNKQKSRKDEIPQPFYQDKMKASSPDPEVAILIIDERKTLPTTIKSCKSGGCKSDACH